MGFIKKFFKKILIAAIGFIFNFFLIVVTLMGACALLEHGGSSSNKHYYANLSGGGCPQEFVSYFNSTAQFFNIPNWVLAGVAKQESGFNHNDAYGGAYGIMQTQKYDFDGSDLWDGLMNCGLGNVYRSLGYNFNSSEDMWELFLTDPQVQIIAGAYEVRYYTNYVLYKKGMVSKLDYNNNENMALINWNADENDSQFREVLRRIFACYNGGPGYGMRVKLDKAQNDYPNKVFSYCMQFRGNGIPSGGGEGGLVGDNETIEKAINSGMNFVGNSPYCWGGGRTKDDIQAGIFDCSSFVYYCYSQAGIELGDYTSVTTYSLIGLGQKVDSSKMRRGDVIFFNTTGVNGHVAIYLGDNKFLHDGSSKGVSIGDLNNDYYKSTFNGEVRRIIQ
ncbi:cell wall-binding protein [Clostridium botulinum]|uniref:Putative NlpC family lipoprotein n=1 Tax=Clostridium botulinum TaxID=1491 RepID=A0A093YK17_CLOBO|nr:NlpC/P60 family protein [Clostridium botulinum]AIW54665.1 putative NlpC family lipoprotein [Clostridium botulinum]AIW54914.1 putative NlpC family lipoprotein [Clostridium botulinum]AIW54969.1 putative NlpC family lipoprotein [Clostridium botulinum]KFX57908.1 cell wall-binding protein [Clostridium botulinum]MBY6805235.1 C40 family peptidase [Clostridium botulinum]